jgi:hypothetical protein
MEQTKEFTAKIVGKDRNIEINEIIEKNKTCEHFGVE